MRRISLCFILQDLIDELGIYFVLFDRPGYGESDPNPNLTVKSEAFDIEELADYLQIGSKFYVIGVSMGSYSIWGCLKYIPDRQATELKFYLRVFLFMLQSFQTLKELPAG